MFDSKNWMYAAGALSILGGVATCICAHNSLDMPQPIPDRCTECTPNEEGCACVPNDDSIAD